MTNQVVKDQTQESILGFKNRGERAKLDFVNARINGKSVETNDIVMVPKLGWTLQKGKTESHAMVKPCTSNQQVQCCQGYY